MGALALDPPAHPGLPLSTGIVVDADDPHELKPAPGQAE